MPVCNTAVYAHQTFLEELNNQDKPLEKELYDDLSLEVGQLHTKVNILDISTSDLNPSKKIINKGANIN
jgi:hypothetical protein